MDYSTIIVAQATPIGAGALTIVRFSGLNIRIFLSKFIKLSSGISLEQVPTHTIHHGFFFDNNGEKIDEILCSVMDGPKSFTGEDTIEVTMHNNQSLVDFAVETVVKSGYCRIAEPGEFTQRAVINGKMDLVQAEAINDLIIAHSIEEIKILLSQRDGSLSNLLGKIKKYIEKMHLLCEASIEFFDDDHSNIDSCKKIELLLLEVDKDLSSIVSEKKSIEDNTRQGVKIIIMGQTNVGKSSLFNALIGANRAIVSNIPGTTRDTIEWFGKKGGMPFTLIDSAGIRDTNDEIELEGIGRAKKMMNESDIILLVDDGITVNEEREIFKKTVLHPILESSFLREKVIVVHSKSDIAGKNDLLPDYEKFSLTQHSVSTFTHAGIDDLWEDIFLRTRKLFDKQKTPFILNKRQRILFFCINEKIGEIRSLFLRGSVERIEIISLHLREILEMIDQITGKTINEKTLNDIFSHFCVGK